MALLLPTIAVDKVTDITPALVRAIKADTILLDVDNTLAFPGSQEPLEGTIEWASAMKNSGIKIIIMSNNFKKRVQPFVAKYDLPFMSFSLKPLPFAYFRAAKKLNSRRKDVVVVGDQIFTDVVGANLAFMKSILLMPVVKETSLSFRIKRKCEGAIRKRILKKGLIAENVFKQEEYNKG